MASVDAFVAQWGMDENSHALLLKLPAEFRTMVVQGFAPKGTTKNINGLLSGYVRSIATANGFDIDGASQSDSGAGQTDTGDEMQLCVSWCLERGLEDQACVDALYALTHEQRVEVVSNYMPKEGTRNPVALFLSYCRSISTACVSGKGKAGKFGPQAKGLKGAPSWDSSTQWQGQTLPGKGIMARSTLGELGGFGAKGALRPQVHLNSSGSSDGALLEAMQSFILQWGLDEVCQAHLFAADPETQRRVIELFGPKDHTQNMSNLFQSFLKSVARRVEQEGFGGAAQATPVLATSRPVAMVHPLRGKAASGKSVIVQGGAPPLVGVKRSLPALGKDVYQFTQYWGLDETCFAALSAQTGEVQRIVFETFAPKAGTNNPNGLFHKFLESIVVAQSGGKAQAGKGKSQAAGKSQPADEMHAFIAHWGLDADSLALLEPQPSYVKETMYLSFVPKPGTNNVNNLFQSYLKSVATAAANGKGANVLASAKGKGTF